MCTIESLQRRSGEEGWLFSASPAFDSDGNKAR